ncbi:hypothetical protein [Calycomorphotria hydatis]|uniref:hypothetical protein n=1 Tax=Calycomorphotria hydatis TaxID=2528027 RepID=UPI00119D2303|nr:hypothetical protein [Calycomorphotria hydatis]
MTTSGAPLTAGIITFIPDSSKGTTGPPATGGIDAEGRFVLRTHEPGDGAVVGSHKVSIQAYKPVPEFDPENPRQYEQEPLIPTRYFDAATSQLTAEVKAGTDNEFTFELTP